MTAPATMCKWEVALAAGGTGRPQVVSVEHGRVKEVIVERAGKLTPTNARMIAAVPDLYEALKPFALFYEKWRAKPLSGMGDEFYSIHTGEDGATLRLTDCKRAFDALAKADGDPR